MSFTNFVQLQNDVAHALLCDAWFARVNVVTRDTLLAEQTRRGDETFAAEVLAYTTPRNGRRGCGVIVENIAMAGMHENVPGPQAELIIRCLVLEDPLQNEAPNTGSLRAADQVAQKILDILHLWNIQGTGLLRADRAAIVELREWRPLRAYQVALKMLCNRSQTARCATPSITNADGTITLACSTTGSEIYYTLDSSMPAPTGKTAQRYTATFTVISGETIRAAAVAENYSISSINQLTIT